MEEEWSTTSTKNYKLIAIVIVAMLSIGGITGIALSGSWSQPEYIPQLTTYYESVTAKQAKELIENNSAILPIDVRSCECSWERGHIPKAIWQVNVNNFHNKANNLLIYCQNGCDSIGLCEELVNHTYGAIYHLEGGYDSWVKSGYEISYP